MLLRVAALAAALAVPGLAQAQGFDGGCAPHGANEVRCVGRGDPRLVGRSYSVALVPSGFVAGGLAIADAWKSTCGSRGEMLGSRTISDGERQVVASFHHDFTDIQGLVQRTFGMCVEVFLRSCALNGRAARCQDVVNAGATRLEVR